MLAVLCVGLCGIAYFSSFEAEDKRNDGKKENAIETTPLIDMTDQSIVKDGQALDLETYPHCGEN